MYYRDVLQNVTGWKARAPKLPVKGGEGEPLVTNAPAPIEAAIQLAAEEMDREEE